MMLTIWAVALIAFVFGGSLFLFLPASLRYKERLFCSVVFGLLFVSPIGVAVEKWGEQNKTALEKEVERIAVSKKDEEVFSRVITEQKGVHLYLFNDKKESYFFVKKENIREITTREDESYLSVYKRYDATKHAYLLPFVKNDEYFVYYRSQE